MEFSYFKSIAESLKSVTQAGVFAAGGKCSLPLPALSLSSAPDVVLGLPLSEAQVKSVIDSASAAPFCAHTWQLSPSQFSISNPEWAQGLEQLCQTVDCDLACDAGQDVSCELSKLLLCEDGGSIKLDRSSEMPEGMFGTLVIQLPSNYEGGELVVSHGSKMEKFNFDGAAGCTSFHYTAFYAECQHEIKPVTKGHRLCLVYNLVYQGSGDRPVPANNEAIEASVASSMQEWGSDQSEDRPLVMAYILDHGMSYPEANLSFQLLKNTHRAVAEALVEAKKLVDFDLYLGQLNFKQSWCIECHYLGGDYEKIDLNDEFAIGDNLVSNDKKTSPEIRFTKNCIVSESFFEEEPDEEEIRRENLSELLCEYKRTALMFWPSGNRIANLGFAKVINQLAECAHGKLEGASELAKGILHAGTLKSVKSLYSSIPVNLCESLLSSLLAIGEVQLVSEGLKVVLDFATADLFKSESFSNIILDIGSKYGWDALASPLQNTFDKLPAISKDTSNFNIGIYCLFLQRISGSQPLEAQKSVCQGLGNVVVGVITNEPIVRLVYDHPSFSIHDITSDSGRLHYLMKSLIALEHDAALLSLVEDVCARPVRYSVKHILAPVLEAVYKEGNQPLQVLLSHCISFLEERTNREIPCPTDWSQSVGTNWCNCKDCTELVKFLQHPTKTEEQFKIGQRRRLHLEQMIRSYKCSVSFDTDRTRSQHRLVVTKTRAGYENSLKEQEEERAILSRLCSLAETASVAPPTKKQKVDTN